MKRILTFFAAAALAVGCGSPEKTAPEKIIVAYVTGYGRPVIPDTDLMTHINYAFGHVTGTFDGVTVQNPERLSALMELKKIKPELKIQLSIGGWTSGNFSEMASTPETRRAFAEDCLRLVEEYGLDGIDIDWEYPTSSVAGISSSPDDTENYTLLMAELREVLGPDRLLTYASDDSAMFIDHKAVLPYVDFVNVMAYDMGNAPNMSSALYESENTTEFTADRAVRAHLEAGIPKEKLVMGLPFYGRGSAEKYADYIDFRNIDTTKAEFTVKWDDKALIPYITDGSGELVFNYENPHSIRLKCKYLLDNELLGAMYWDYGADDDNGSLSKVVAFEVLGVD